MKLETRQKRKHRRDDLEARFDQATLRIDNLVRDCLSSFVILLRNSVPNVGNHPVKTQSPENTAASRL